MNAPTRPARRGRKTRSDDTLPAQLDWREIRNHMAPLAPLSDAQIESIHLASLRLLEEYGIESIWSSLSGASGAIWLRMSRQPS